MFKHPPKVGNIYNVQDDVNNDNDDRKQTLNKTSFK